MIELFQTRPFIAGLAVIGWSGFGIFVRFVSRNDRHRSWVLSDFAVGLEILIALLTLIASRSVDYLVEVAQIGTDDPLRLQLENEMNVSFYGLLAIMMTIWIVSSLIRKKGWESDNEPNLIWGVVVPNLLSIYSMFFFFYLFKFLLQ